MCRMSLSVLILCLILHQAHQNKITEEETSESNKHFDIIVLSQEWPVTVCKYWKYILSPGGECRFPKQKHRWIVHGIWPRTMEGTYLENCNKSWAFDPEELKSIEGGLMQAQTEVYKELDAYIFWKHEWRRHGTCAAVFEPFNTQLKYFSKGIELNLKYSLSDMLEAANIFPSDTTYLEPEEVADAVQAVTKKSPMIGCYVIDDVPYLQEVRICLDKEFNLIDCNRHVVDKYCYSHKGFIYPANE